MLSIAAELGRILVSHDRKTMPRHFARFRETRLTPGLIVLSQDLEIGAAIEELLLIWVATGAEEWVDHLGFVPGLGRRRRLAQSDGKTTGDSIAASTGEYGRNCV